MTKLIILDRDGVINDNNFSYVTTVDEWIAIPSSLLAIAKLCNFGYTISVATNQSGVARGYYDEKILELMHTKMQNELAKVGGRIDTIFYCPHHPDDKCHCRKPKPGLLYKIRDHYKIDLTNIAFVGDRKTDFEAAINAGAKPILLGDKYPNLAAYVDDLLAE